MELTTTRPPVGTDLYDRLTDPLSAIDKMGNWIARSGMFGCNKVEQGMVIATVCMTERISLTTFQRTYDVLHDGKIRKKALAALAEVRMRAGKHGWLADGSDGKSASIRLTFDGQTIISTFTMDDAKRMGASFKDGSAWVKTPGNMLRVRAISNGLAMITPEIYAGETGEDLPAYQEPAPLNLAATPPQTPVGSGTPTAAPAGEPLTAAASRHETGTSAPAPAGPRESATAKADAPRREAGVNSGSAAAVIPVESKVVPMPVTDAPADRKELAAAGLAPANLGPELPEALCNELALALGDNVKPAVQWLVGQGWLKPGQFLQHLTEPRARRIIKNSASFLAKVNGGAGGAE